MIPFLIIHFNSTPHSLTLQAVQAAFDSGAKIEDDGIEEAFEVISETSETVKTGLWVGDCFIFTSAGEPCSHLR